MLQTEDTSHAPSICTAGIGVWVVGPCLAGCVQLILQALTLCTRERACLWLVLTQLLHVAAPLLLQLVLIPDAQQTPFSSCVTLVCISAFCFYGSAVKCHHFKLLSCEACRTAC